MRNEEANLVLQIGAFTSSRQSSTQAWASAIVFPSFRLHNEYCMTSADTDSGAHSNTIDKSLEHKLTAILQCWLDPQETRIYQDSK